MILDNWSLMHKFMRVYVATAIVSIGGLGQQSLGQAVLKDGQYSNACGIIACFTAGRAVGATFSLDDLALKCHWQADTSSSIQQLVDGLGAYGGISVAPAKLGPQALCEILQTGVGTAVLFTRKDSDQINHAIAVLGVEPEGVLVLDYPELMKTVPIENIVDVWDGHALIFRRQAEPGIVSICQRYPIGISIGAAASLFGMCTMGLRWRRQRSA